MQATFRVIATLTIHSCIIMSICFILWPSDISYGSFTYWPVGNGATYRNITGLSEVATGMEETNITGSQNTHSSSRSSNNLNTPWLISTVLFFAKLSRQRPGPFLSSRDIRKFQDWIQLPAYSTKISMQKFSLCDLTPQCGWWIPSSRG